MSAKTLALSVLVKLVDQITRPLDRIMAKIRAFGALGRGIADLTRRFGELAGKIGALGVLGAGLAFVGPIQAAAKYDQALRDIAITSGTTSKAMAADVKALGTEYEALALVVGQRSSQLALAAQILTGANVQRDVIAKLMPQIGRATTAAGADITDMAKMTVSLTQNLGIAADQMERVFAGLVVAGKEGRFELKDMARAFPVISGHMASLGVKDLEAAAHAAAVLQIAMKGAAEPMQAANNLENFLSKLLSKETIKNFKEKGIDIKGVMEEAVFEGINPIEAALKKILDMSGMATAEIDKLQARARKGGITDPAEIHALSERIKAIRGAGEIAETFGDMQVKNLLIPVLANVEELKDIKAKVLAAMAADPKVGAMADDFISRMAGMTASLDRFAEVGEQAMRRVGNAFSTWLGPANTGMEALLGHLQALDAKAPGAGDGVLTLVGGVLLLVAGLGVLGQGIGFVVTGLQTLWALVSTLLNPLGLLAGLGALLYVYWDQTTMKIASSWRNLVDDIKRLWTGVEEAFQGALGKISGWADTMVPGWVKRMFGGGIDLGTAALVSPAGAAGPSIGLGAQKQEVGGKIVVQVEGPGKVTSVTSDSRAVPIEADRGQMLLVP